MLAHSPASPPPFTPAALLTGTDPTQWVTLGLAAVAGTYLYGVYRLRRRGDRWPVGRAVLFLGGGLGALAAATVSGLAAYDETLFSAHMAQHMLLAMIAPIFLALGAPVTLALRTLPRTPRRVLLTVLHSRYVRVVSWPPVAFALFVSTPFGLYFSGWFEVTLRNELVHEVTHLHMIVVGCLFFWPLLGLDPLPGRWSYPARALLMFLSLPLHAFLGVTIMNSTVVLAGDHYAALDLSWVDPAADQTLGGGLLWASGDLVTLPMLAAFVLQWIRSSEREAARVDRQLDRDGDESVLAAYNARLATLAARDRSEHRG